MQVDRIGETNKHNMLNKKLYANCDNFLKQKLETFDSVASTIQAINSL